MAEQLIDTLGRRNRKLPDKICPVCGEIFRPVDRDSKFCSRKCMYIGRKTPSICIPGPQNPLYKGGWIDKKGYLQIKVNGKSMRYHRYVMEQYLDRKLLPDEDVHHKNGNKADNCIENLEVVLHGRHSKYHNLRRTHKRGYKVNISDNERKRRSEFMHFVHKQRRKYETVRSAEFCASIC